MYVSQFVTHFQNTYRQQEQGEQKSSGSYKLAGIKEFTTWVAEIQWVKKSIINT